MSWEIALIFTLLGLALASFIWERVPPDVTAITLFAVLLVTGLLPMKDALRVFSNPAPITVGAMFVISAALERCGAIEVLAGNLSGLTRLSPTRFMAVLVLSVAVISAFINNTPVVVVFMPVVMALAHKMKKPASKFLIPLSYAAIFGGTCTLIGTSTNILVSGLAVEFGQKPFSMFELSAVGLPLLIIGALYLVFVGSKLLPIRETLTQILSEDQRHEYITEVYVQPGSPVVGKTLAKASILKEKGIRVIEIVRNGVVMQAEQKTVILASGDRLVLACRPQGIAHARNISGVDFVSETGLGLEQIAAHEGVIVEGIVPPTSPLIGKTILELNFRQRYRMIILAVHRRGRNLRDKLGTLRLEFGDTLLLLGTDGAIQTMRNSDAVYLIDRPPLPSADVRKKMPFVLAAIIGLIVSVTAGWAPIEEASIVSCAFLFLTGCIRPKEAYGAIQWNILFIIFAMLGMGLAIEQTGASRFLAHQILHSVDVFVAPAYRPFVMLACVYAVTAMLTEFLSNNAAAVVMAVLAFGLAHSLRVDPRPFLVAVTVAASASFSTPIGYQTNTYVYGAGGYRFSDFVKVGLPLNLLFFVGSVLLIPLFWPF